MKKYRIKEEVKKYIDTYYHDKIEYLELWENDCFTLEALEEVEEKKIKLALIFGNRMMAKSDVSLFTEQERADIEKFLNTFGSWEKMIKMIDEHVSDEDYWCSMPVNKNKKQEDFNFQDWLKEK